MPPTERSTTREVTARRRRLITQRFTAGESTSTCGDDERGGRQPGTLQAERRHLGAAGRLVGGAAGQRQRPEDWPGGAGAVAAPMARAAAPGPEGGGDSQTDPERGERRSAAATTTPSPVHTPPLPSPQNVVPLLEWEETKPYFRSPFPAPVHAPPRAKRRTPTARRRRARSVAYHWNMCVFRDARPWGAAPVATP